MLRLAWFSTGRGPGSTEPTVSGCVMNGQSWMRQLLQHASRWLVGRVVVDDDSFDAMLDVAIDRVNAPARQIRRVVHRDDNVNSFVGALPHDDQYKVGRR